MLSVACADHLPCCLHALLRFNDDLPSRVTIVPLARLRLDALQFVVGTKNVHSLAGLRTAATDSAVFWRPARVAPPRPPSSYSRRSAIGIVFCRFRQQPARGGGGGLREAVCH